MPLRNFPFLIVSECKSCPSAQQYTDRTISDTRSALARKLPLICRLFVLQLVLPYSASTIINHRLSHTVLWICLERKGKREKTYVIYEERNRRDNFLWLVHMRMNNKQQKKGKNAWFQEKCSLKKSEYIRRFCRGFAKPTCWRFIPLTPWRGVLQ